MPPLALAPASRWRLVPVYTMVPAGDCQYVTTDPDDMCRCGHYGRDHVGRLVEGAVVPYGECHAKPRLPLGQCICFRFRPVRTWIQD